MAEILTPDRDAAMRAYYDQRAGEYDQWYLREGRFAERPDAGRWHAEVALLRQHVAGFGYGRLLEIAAGTGWWTRHLARRAAVTALDYAPGMLAQLQARLLAQGLQAGRVRADAYHLPLAAASFDCCFFGFWLSHVPYARLPDFLGELRRVVRPCGRVMVVDSAPAEPDQAPGVEYLHERILNDGSRHAVLKILHTPETLGAALAPLGEVVEAWHTGKFFSAAIVEVRPAAL
jgi:demethylmenaquinone methyltransferase/2-methoxy-6-polyprenyl-1,4-benzoquinol methylase